MPDPTPTPQAAAEAAAALIAKTFGPITTEIAPALDPERSTEYAVRIKDEFVLPIVAGVYDMCAPPAAVNALARYAEALGFTVTWQLDDVAVLHDNATCEVTVWQTDGAGEWPAQDVFTYLGLPIAGK